MTMKKTALIFLPVFAALAIALMLVDHTSLKNETAEKHSTQQTDEEDGPSLPKTDDAGIGTPSTINRGVQIFIAPEEREPTGDTRPEIEKKTEAEPQNNDIVIDIFDTTNRLPPVSEDKIREDQEWRRLEQNLPCRGSINIRMATLGQQVKFCDWIIIGNVTRVETNRGESLIGSVTVTLNGETNLFGKLPRKHRKPKLTLHKFRTISDCIIDPTDVPEFHVGDRLLAFLVRGRVPVMFNMLQFSFEKPPHKKQDGDTPVLMYNPLGVVTLDSAEAEREFLMAVDGYLLHLRRKGRDLDDYYRFLRRLARSSPVERIRDDAGLDLVNLLATPGVAERAVDDDAVDNSIRDYARFLIETRKRRAGW